MSIEELTREHPLRPGIKFGVYDGVDKVWLGDETGPKLFTDIEINGNMMAGSLLATLAAEIAAIRTGFQPGRLRAMEYVEGPLRYKDEITTLMTAEEALIRKESGRAL